MSETIKATINILEHYHHNGGYYEIPVEVINTVEQELEELEELDKLLQQKENIIKEVRGYIKEVKIGSQEVENTWAVDICNMVLEILDKLNKE